MRNIYSFDMKISSIKYKTPPHLLNPYQKIATSGQHIKQLKRHIKLSKIKRFIHQQHQNQISSLNDSSQTVYIIQQDPTTRRTSWQQYHHPLLPFTGIQLQKTLFALISLTDPLTVERILSQIEEQNVLHALQWPHREKGIIFKILR